MEILYVVQENYKLYESNEPTLGMCLIILFILDSAVFKDPHQISFASRRRSNPERYFVHSSFWIASPAARKDGYFEQIKSIVSAPGVGKTTFLLKQTLLANQEGQRALYLSADHLFFNQKPLNLVDTLYKETQVRLLCMDEIHQYPNWAQELKNIADSYPGFQILFSGSSAIDIIHSFMA